MKVFLALVIGIGIGAAAFWYFNTSQGQARVQATGQQIQSAAQSAHDAIQEQLRVLDLRSNTITNELARTGQVIRRKAHETGQAIADATADARTTAVIKAKLLGHRDLSALNISVNTTAGVVTLSGSVTSPDDIGKAMVLAMQTDGVHEVISTLQVKPRTTKPG